MHGPQLKPLHLWGRRLASSCGLWICFSIGPLLQETRPLLWPSSRAEWHGMCFVLPAAPEGRWCSLWCLWRCQQRGPRRDLAGLLLTQWAVRGHDRKACPHPDQSALLGRTRVKASVQRKQCNNKGCQWWRIWRNIKSVRKRKASVHSGCLLAGLPATASLQLWAGGSFENTKVGVPLPWL